MRIILYVNASRIYLLASFCSCSSPMISFSCVQLWCIYVNLCMRAFVCLVLSFIYSLGSDCTAHKNKTKWWRPGGGQTLGLLSILNVTKIIWRVLYNWCVSWLVFSLNFLGSPIFELRTCKLRVQNARWNSNYNLINKMNTATTTKSVGKILRAHHTAIVSLNT